MNTLLDNLFARRPNIHYVCPPICGIQFVPTSSGAPAISFEAVNPLACVQYREAFNILSWDNYPGALCYNVYQSPAPPPPIPEGLTCVNYFLTNTTILSSQFTWDAYPDATSYNIYRTLPENPGYLVKTQSDLPISTLSIDCESVVVTANTPSGETSACPPLFFCSPCAVELEEWLARVEANGGTIPSTAEQLAVCQFISEMKAAALWDRMFALTYFSPNGRATAETWLKKGPMSDIWNWFISGPDTPANPAQLADQQFTIDGINNANLFADTTIPVNSLFTDIRRCGVSGYASRPSVGIPTDVLGAFCGGREPNVTDGYFALHPWKPGSIDPVFGYTRGSCWDFNHQLTGGPIGSQGDFQGCGFVTMSRQSFSDWKIYYGALYTPFSLLAQDSFAQSDVVVPSGNLRLFDDTAQHNTYTGFCSFLGFHEPFNRDESERLFGCVQRFRQMLGGGYV